MKRKFLLISMCAAVMFSTSCSKEDNETVDTKDVNNQTEVNATKAVTVSAKQKSSVSKVALGNKNSTNTKYDEVFSAGDILTLYLNNEVITTLQLQDGAGETSATFYGEIPVSANGQTISAKILPKSTLSGFTKCTDFEAAVSNYASLSGEFNYDASADNFSLTLYDEVSYFVVETNMSEVDINGTNYTVNNAPIVFAFNTEQKISSTKLGLNNQSLTAGGNVYFKTVNLKTLTFEGSYWEYNDLQFSIEIEYSDVDTWQDMVDKYDFIYTENNNLGPNGKIIKFSYTTTQGNVYNAQLKHDNASNFYLVPCTSKISDYTLNNYYLDNWQNY